MFEQRPHIQGRSRSFHHRAQLRNPRKGELCGHAIHLGPHLGHVLRHRYHRDEQAKLKLPGKPQQDPQLQAKEFGITQQEANATLSKRGIRLKGMAQIRQLLVAADVEQPDHHWAARDGFDRLSQLFVQLLLGRERFVREKEQFDAEQSDTFGAIFHRQFGVSPAANVRKDGNADAVPRDRRLMPPSHRDSQARAVALHLGPELCPPGLVRRNQHGSPQAVHRDLVTARDALEELGIAADPGNADLPGEKRRMRPWPPVFREDGSDFSAGEEDGNGWKKPPGNQHASFGYRLERMQFQAGQVAEQEPANVTEIGRALLGDFAPFRTKTLLPAPEGALDRVFGIDPVLGDLVPYLVLQSTVLQDLPVRLENGGAGGVEGRLDAGDGITKFCRCLDHGPLDALLLGRNLFGTNGEAVDVAVTDILLHMGRPHCHYGGQRNVQERGVLMTDAGLGHLLEGVGLFHRIFLWAGPCQTRHMKRRFSCVFRNPPIGKTVRTGSDGMPCRWASAQRARLRSRTRQRDLPVPAHRV